MPTATKTVVKSKKPRVPKTLRSRRRPSARPRMITQYKIFANRSLDKTIAAVNEFIQNFKGEDWHYCHVEGEVQFLAGKWIILIETNQPLKSFGG